MLDGGTGVDQMTGGTGDDIYVVDNGGDMVTEASGEGTDEVRTTLSAYSLSTHLENLTGLGASNQFLVGNGSNNIIDGGAGADTMVGQAGDDTYVVDNAGDSVNENAGEGTDEIRTNLATYTLAALANVENLTGTNAAGQTSPATARQTSSPRGRRRRHRRRHRRRTDAPATAATTSISSTMPAMSLPRMSARGTDKSEPGCRLRPRAMSRFDRDLERPS